LIRTAGVLGEIGLDASSGVPLALQTRNFELILAMLTEEPRLTSVHSVGATKLVLELLERHRPKGIVLHWWRGSENETIRAIELGCYFSVNSAEIRRPKVLSLLPLERVLTETDHPFGNRGDRPKLPGRMTTVEDGLAKQWNLDVASVRRAVWRNLLEAANQTSTLERLPANFQRTMLGV
jgi:TatD DNase family protein